MNSRVFESLMLLQTGSRAWEVGFAQRAPVPDLLGSLGDQLAEHALEVLSVKRNTDRSSETSHVFCLPALLQAQSTTLQEQLAR
jgi:hypothetical protein